MPRFYIPPDQWNLDALALESEEAHHCDNVLRMAVGDRVTAFNGQGAEASAEIVEINGMRVGLKTISSQKSAPLAVRVALGQAVPKGKNMDLIVQKATELGAAAVHPLLSERSVIRLHAEEACKKQEKWHRVALEACKQSGQNWLPEVTGPQTPAEYFAGRFKDDYDLKLVASLEPDARGLREILAEYEESNRRRPVSTVVLIGPEGDFTPSEMNAAKAAGCLPLALGPIVLRTETAAIHALSILGYELRS